MRSPERSDGDVGRTIAREYEAGLARDARRRAGIFYTPPELARRVVAWALERWRGDGIPVVCDPSCGAGAFLLAAAEELATRGHDRAEVVRHLVGIDVDRQALAVATEAIRRWSGGSAPLTVLAADALVEDWPVVPDIVVGNPPFLGQLTGATARTAARRARLRATLGEVAAGYVDDASLFLAAASRKTGPGGVVAMLQPSSVVATEGAARVRSELAPRLRLLHDEGDGHFDASVRILVVGLADDGQPIEWRAPAPTLHGDRMLGDLAAVTAPFRDEYYGLAAHVEEWREGLSPLVTSGLLDPGRCDWGHRPARFARRVWRRPAVDARQLGALGSWAARQAAPKVLVAMQTKVLEAAADEAGTWLPVTPVVSVVPDDPGDLWRVLAVLLSPPASEWAVASARGSGLSSDTVRVPAALLRRLPLPRRGEDWDTAAEAVRAGDLRAAAAASCAAYGVDGEPVTSWWAGRLPVR